MVRLFRGAGVRGRGMPPRVAHVRPMMPRHIIPHNFEPDFIPPYAVTRGRLIRGHPMRPGPPRPPLPPHHRMAPLPPPLPPRHPPRPQRHPPLLPHHPLHPRDMPIPITRIPHPMRLPGRRPGMPPPMGPMPPGPPLRPGPHLGLLRGRGRGGLMRRGVAVKRLGNLNNSRAKKPKRSGKPKTAESEMNKPWVTTEALKTEILKKYKLYQTAKEKKTSESDWQAYTDQKILVGEMTNTAKLEYIGSHPEVDVSKIIFTAAAAKG